MITTFSRSAAISLMSGRQAVVAEYTYGSLEPQQALTQGAYTMPSISVNSSRTRRSIHRTHRSSAAYGRPLQLSRGEGSGPHDRNAISRASLTSRRDGLGSPALQQAVARPLHIGGASFLWRTAGRGRGWCRSCPLCPMIDYLRSCVAAPPQET